MEKIEIILTLLYFILELVNNISNNIVIHGKNKSPYMVNYNFKYNLQLEQSKIIKI
jgi:hypothetical protein